MRGWGWGPGGQASVPFPPPSRKPHSPARRLCGISGRHMGPQRKQCVRGGERTKPRVSWTQTDPSHVVTGAPLGTQAREGVSPEPLAGQGLGLVARGEVGESGEALPARSP